MIPSLTERLTDDVLLKAISAAGLYLHPDASHDLAAMRAVLAAALSATAETTCDGCDFDDRSNDPRPPHTCKRAPEPPQDDERTPPPAETWPDDPPEPPMTAERKAELEADYQEWLKKGRCVSCRWCQKTALTMGCANQDSPTANRLVRADFGCTLYEARTVAVTRQPESQQRADWEKPAP